MSDTPDAGPGTDPGSPSDPSDEPVAAPDDRVEWQPVIDGDRIEWQPVMVSEATAEPPVALPEPTEPAPEAAADEPLGLATEPPVVEPPVAEAGPETAAGTPAEAAAGAAAAAPAGAAAAAPAGTAAGTSPEAPAEAAEAPAQAADAPPGAEAAEPAFVAAEALSEPVEAPEAAADEPAAGQPWSPDTPPDTLREEPGDWGEGEQPQDAGDWPSTGEWQPDAAEAGEWPAEAANWEEQGPEFDYPDEAETAGVATAARARPSGPRPRSGARRPPPAKRPRPAASEDAPAPNVKKQVIVLTLLTVLVLGIGGAAFFLSRDARDNADEAQGDSPPASSPTASTLPESAMETFSDPETGFTLKYPRTWERLVAPRADIRLVVNAGGNDGFQVRVAPIETPATTDNIGNFKAVTDEVVLGDRSARLLQQQLVTVNGLLAYYYLYSFQDPVTNTQGVHAHYFIFEGNRMFMLNFQTVPIDEFPRQAGVVDQIAESFTVPNRATTTAPPTTVP